MGFLGVYFGANPVFNCDLNFNTGEVPAPLNFICSSAFVLIQYTAISDCTKLLILVQNIKNRFVLNSSFQISHFQETRDVLATLTLNIVMNRLLSVVEVGVFFS